MKTKERFLGILLGLTVMLGVMTGMSLTALASGLPSVNYLDAEGVRQSISSYNVISNSTSNPVKWNNEWYVVNEDVTIDGDVAINGDVHLVLCDGKKLTVNNTIHEYSGGTNGKLSIYAQSTGNGMGALKVSAINTVNNNKCYGIRIPNLIVNGGNVNVSSTEGYPSIGLSIQGMTVNGGKVDVSATGEGCSKGIDISGSGTIYRGVTVNGGELISTGSGVNGYGIDGGIIVQGGKVTASGIGTVEESIGVYSPEMGVTVTGGELTATAFTGPGFSFGISTLLNFVTIGNRGKVTASGGNIAIEGIVMNSIDGTGWTDPAGTVGKEDIAVNTTDNDRTLSFKKVQFPAVSVDPVPQPQTETKQTEAPQPQTEAPQTVATPAPVVENITIPTTPAKIKAKAKKNKITVSWKKIKKNKKTKALRAMIKGVEVQYSTDPSFSKETTVTKTISGKKTKYVIKGLQRKSIYYVRVRYSDGTGGFSNWSKVKRVKTK